MNRPRRLAPHTVRETTAEAPATSDPVLSLSTRIRRARSRVGLTQRALAEAVGVGPSAVGQWEGRGATVPSVENLLRIAHVTGVSLEWLALGRSNLEPTLQTRASPVGSSEWQQQLTRVIDACEQLPVDALRSLANALSIATVPAHRRKRGA